MPRNRRSKKTSSVYGWFVGIGLALLLGTAAYVQFGPSRQVPPDMRRTTDQTTASKATNVKVFEPEYHNGDLGFKQTEKAPPEGQDPMVYAVNQFLQGSKVAPAGAKCTSAKKEGDTLVLDFSKEFDRTFGTEDEQTLLVGLSKAAGQFPGVQKIRILVDGKPIDSWGNVELTEPIPVSGL